MKHGDFTELADNYARYRPGYAPMVRDVFLRLAPAGAICLDAGAGTGIWSRQISGGGGVEVIAVEPNDAMRAQGERQSAGYSIAWQKGSAEHTGVASASCHLACMASSFHWPNFDAAVREFDRVLKPGGYFMALWNTRLYECNPLLAEIEEYLRKLVPELKRVSSGRSEFCAHLTEKMQARPEFADVLYMEGQHVEKQTPEQYAGLWESVNDVRVQAGEDRFARFMDFVRQKTAGLPFIEARYLTRAWLARKRE